MKVYCVLDSGGGKGSPLLGVFLRERDATAQVTILRKTFGVNAVDLTIEEWDVAGTEFPLPPERFYIPEPTS